MSNINNNMQTQTSNTLYNAIIEAGSKDRPPILAPGNYIQWKSRIKRYIDTKPNHELIHFCLTNPPYELGWKEKAVLDSEGNPTTATQKVCETYKSVTQEIRDQLNAEAEAVQIILTGIDNDIYSTDNSPRIHRNAGYESQRSGNVVGARETVGPSMVSPDAVDSGHIFDKEPEQKVQNDDHYDVFAIECQHPEQSESVHKTYLIEQDAHNVIIESEDMNYDSEQIDQNDEDADVVENVSCLLL
nr:hypothetical protein [Tanacetum cinerariifolium]GEY89343.1 hypothetical protein [Tanacetum cinerariifolium]